MKWIGKPRPCDAIRDAGESLVELLVSIVIMGIAVTAILGAIGVSASSSATHEGITEAQGELRNWAEKLSYNSTCSVPAYAGDPSFTPGSTTTEYWLWNPTDPAGPRFATAANGGSCGGSKGVYRVTLRLAPPAGQGASVTQSLAVVVRCEVASC